MIDPRSLANVILDLAESDGVPVTNLSLNKIAYFLHGAYLAKFGEPLIDAKIEAWQYGPVFREIYHQFKGAGDKPIKHRAKTLNLESGEYEVSGCNLKQSEYDFLKSVAMPYIRMRAGTLVRLSHVENGPWHRAWFYDGDVNPGMEITNKSIEAYFREQLRH